MPLSVPGAPAPGAVAPAAAAAAAADARSDDARSHASPIGPRVGLERVDRTDEHCRNAMLRNDRAVGDGVAQAFILGERVEVPFARQWHCIPQFGERI